MAIPTGTQNAADLGQAGAPITLADGTVAYAALTIPVDATGTPTNGSGATANQVQGNAAAGATDTGNPVKVGGVYLASLPTLATGQRGDLQLNVSGAANVSPGRAVGLTDATGNVAIYPYDRTTNNVFPLAVMGHVFNGITWDRTRKPSGFSRITSTAAGGSPTVAKASAGDAGVFWGQNGAAITYLQIYNVATTPVVGTTAIVATFPIPANAPFSAPAGWASSYFGTGIGYAFTTDAAGTAGAVAAAVTSFLFTFA